MFPANPFGHTPEFLKAEMEYRRERSHHGHLPQAFIELLFLGFLWALTKIGWRVLIFPVRFSVSWRRGREHKR